MKVTPVKKKFGKYAVGDVFELKDGVARVFIHAGKLRPADAEPVAAMTYQTRMMQAAPVAETFKAHTTILVDEAADPAPYGYKADGTPRKRPGRAPAAK